MLAPLGEAGRQHCPCPQRRDISEVTALSNNGGSLVRGRPYPEGTLGQLNWLVRKAATMSALHLDGGKLRSQMIAVEATSHKAQEK